MNMKYLITSLALLLFSAHLHAVTFRVDDIRLEGLQRVSASPVFAALPIRIGEEIDSENIRQILGALFATGYFTNVQVARDGNVLIIILQERPAIKSVEVDGNKAIKTEQLEEVFDDQNLKEGEILQRPMLQQIVRELERQYIGRGRYGAKVEANIEDLPNNMVSVKIDVDEGSAAKIKHINIVGNKLFTDEEIFDNWEMSTSGWFSFFTKDDQYSKEKLSGDVEKLESFYLDRGYLDFAVTSSQVSVSPDKKTVYITLNVEEGEVYTVNEIDIAGDPKLSEDRIRRLILLREGDIFSQQKMTNTSEYMTNMLGNAGYTNAKVEGIPDKNQEDKTVKLNFLIDPGKRVYVRRIEFRGNTKTSDDVLRREMRQMEGSSASNARIEQSKVRLERLGFFKEVNVENRDVPGTTDLIDVEYTVEEQASGSITATVGYSQSTKLNLGVSLQQNNWLGTGKQVALSANKNIYQTYYSYSYNDPYFTADGVNRGFKAYYQKQDYTRLSSSRTSGYQSNTYGGNVSFGYPISEISRVGLSVGISHEEISSYSSPPLEVRASPALRAGSGLEYITQSDWQDYIVSGVPRDQNGNFIEYALDTYRVNDEALPDIEPGFLDKYGSIFDSGTLTFSWSRMTLNRGVMATRGTSQSLQLFTTVPGSDLEYYKLTYDAQAFVPVWRDFTLRFKTTLGYGDGFGEMDEMPFFQNFRAGGFGSVRGFEKFTMGPKGSPGYNYDTSTSGWQDLNRNGSIENNELLSAAGGAGTAYILCEDPTSGYLIGSDPRLNKVCEPGKLMYVPRGISNYNDYAFGGNILMEFSTELLLPIPFVEDTRSMQLVAFVDTGNVFSSYCGDRQLACSNVDLGEMKGSFGLGFTWISGMGPMTFSYSRPFLNYDDRLDIREAFQFSFGAGF